MIVVPFHRFGFDILPLCSTYKYGKKNIMNNELHNDNTPEYFSEFSIPAGQRGIIVARFYDVWGDGSDNGWQQPVTPPNVVLDGNPITLGLWFSANSVATPEPDGFNQEDYINGQTQGGFDQHSHYYQQSFDALPYDSILTISGQFQITGYFSVVVYLGLDSNSRFQLELLDRQMEATPYDTNPYIEGNPSVISYVTGFSGGKKYASLIPAPDQGVSVSAREGEILFYRADAETSSTRFSDEIALDGCSKGYLSATKSNAVEQEVLILRIKMPTTFIGSAEPDVIFGQYQCRQVSISANIESQESVDPLLDFWTVSSRMLNEYRDSDGYAYVFFAPTDFTQQQATIQGTQPRKPPVLTWGRYTGYLLGDPNHAVIIRYRDPSPDWEGNPVRAVCYLNSEDNQPVTSEALGEWLPEMFGDTMANFESGHIGLVYDNQPWPASSQSPGK